MLSALIQKRCPENPIHPNNGSGAPLSVKSRLLGKLLLSLYKKYFLNIYS